MKTLGQSIGRGHYSFGEHWRIVKSKHKEITSKNEEGWWFSKNNKKKQLTRYYGDAMVKIKVLTSMRVVDIKRQYYCRNVFSRHVDLAYDNWAK